MKKVVLVGNYGVGNVGDEILKLGAIRKLKKDFSQKLEIRVVDGEDLVRLPSGFRSFLDFRWIKTLLVILKSDSLVFGGGGLFDTKKPRSLFIWGQYIFWAKLFQKNIYLWAQSFSSPKWNYIHRPLFKFFFKNAKEITVRDELSSLVVESIIEDRAKVVDDLAKVYIESLNSEKVNIRKEESRIIISVRGGTYWEKSDFQDNFVQDLVNFIRKNKKPFHIVFIPFQIGAGEQDDLHLCKVLIQKLQNYKIEKIELLGNSVEEVLESYKNASLVVGCRLHSVILAHLIGVSYKALNYHDKVVSYIKTHDIENIDNLYELNIDGVNKLFKDLTNPGST